MLALVSGPQQQDGKLIFSLVCHKQEFYVTVMREHEMPTSKTNKFRKCHKSVYFLLTGQKTVCITFMEE